MNSIEYALTLVFSSIGSEYEMPEERTINDIFDAGNTFPNPFYGDEKTPVKLKFGTQKEVNAWLATSSKKYPVVWLVYPLTKSFKNDGSSVEYYPNARLIFAINNRSDKLVETRNQTTKVVLDSIVAKFRELMRTSAHKKYISVDKKSDIKEIWRPNYATSANQSANAVVDVWDAITFDCGISLTPSCIPNV